MLLQTNPSSQPKPVYKSENQKTRAGKFKFGRVFSNTDALANNLYDQPIKLKIYQYGKNGSHKVVFDKDINLDQIKEAMTTSDVSLTDKKMSV